MSKRLFSGSKYFLIGLVSLLILINLVDILESASIDCTKGPVSCVQLIDILTYVALFLLLVGVSKLLLFLWKDYKILEKYKEFEVKYLGKSSKKEEKVVKGKCEMCGTINDPDAVYCKKCAASLSDDEININ